MTSDSDPNERRLPKVTLALPEGPLRQRVLKLLEDSDVEVEVIPSENLAKGLAGAGGDVVLVERTQVLGGEDLEALTDVVQDEDDAGVAVLGEDDPGARVQLLAAGFSSVFGKDQKGSELAASLEALAEAEAAGGIDGPEVGGSAVQPRLADFLTRSPRMREFVDLVGRVIAADTTLLILGPTGVGKEHLARAIHGESPRSSGPFVAVNCAALPEQLLEAELFGHTKGAFTGAQGARQGHFERAGGGTMFLDEIGDMPLHLQAKLLTVLQRHEVTPVGSEQPVAVDVRVMVATNRNLSEEVAAGRFREDLFFRLNVVPLQIPSLGERPEDVPELVGRFIQHFRTAMPASSVEGVSDPVIDALMRYAWPGNIRELLNVVERAMLLGRSARITLDDLPPEVRSEPAGVTATRSGEPGGEAAVSEDWHGLSLREVREREVAKVERRYLHSLLLQAGGNLAETAGLAGLSARALYAKMKRYDLKKESYKGSADGEESEVRKSKGPSNR